MRPIRYKDAVNSFELLTYHTDSFRGSNIEQEGTGASVGQRRLTSAPGGYHTFAIEPRYSRLIDMGSIVQEISVGYRFLNEASSGDRHAHSVLQPAWERGCKHPALARLSDQSGRHDGERVLYR